MKSPALLVLALAIAAAPLAAQHPNFVGTWALDTVHSDAGQMKLASGTYTIAAHGDTLVLDRVLISDLGTTNSHLVLGLDGQPWVNTVSAGGQSVQLTTVSRWAQDTLVMQSTGSMMGTDASISDRWLQSADGKSFTAIRDTEAGGQTLPTTKLVYTRKP